MRGPHASHLLLHTPSNGASITRVPCHNTPHGAEGNVTISHGHPPSRPPAPLLLPLPCTMHVCECVTAACLAQHHVLARFFSRRWLQDVSFIVSETLLSLDRHEHRASRRAPWPPTCPRHCRHQAGRGAAWPALQRARVNRTPARSRDALPQRRHPLVCFGCPQEAHFKPVEQTPTLRSRRRAAGPAIPLQQLISKLVITFCTVLVPAHVFGASFPRPLSPRAHRQLGGQAVGSPGHVAAAHAVVVAAAAGSAGALIRIQCVEKRIANVSAERNTAAQRNVDARALKHVRQHAAAHAAASRRHRPDSIGQPLARSHARAQGRAAGNSNRLLQSHRVH